MMAASHNHQCNSNIHNMSSKLNLPEETNDRFISHPFPKKLHDMLEYVEESGMQHIVSWQPDANAFRVHEPDAFVELVMKKFFRQTRYKSFQRQLHLYNFSRCWDGPNKGSYQHELFVKGERDLSRYMARKARLEKKESEKASSKEARNQKAEDPSPSHFIKSRFDAPILVTTSRIWKIAQPDKIDCEGSSSCDKIQQTTRIGAHQNDMRDALFEPMSALDDKSDKLATRDIHSYRLTQSMSVSEQYSSRTSDYLTSSFLHPLLEPLPIQDNDEPLTRTVNFSEHDDDFDRDVEEVTDMFEPDALKSTNLLTYSPLLFMGPSSYCDHGCR